MRRDDYRDMDGAFFGAKRGEFTRIVDVSGTGVHRPVSFEHDILWVRSTETRLVVTGPSGRVIGDSSTYCDVGAVMTSLRGAGLPGEMMREYDVEVGGKLRVVVLMTVEDRPIIVHPTEKAFRSSAKMAMTALNDWMERNDDLIAAWWAVPNLERYDLPKERCPVFIVPEKTEVEVWSSDMMAMSIAAQIDAVRKRLEPVSIGLDAEDKAKAAKGIEQYLAELAEELSAPAPAPVAA